VELKRAAVYVRQRGEQGEHGLDAQRAACERWAAERRMQIVAEYEGETANRVSAELLADLGAGKFDVLIAELGPETFTRDASRYQALLAAAAEAGVEVCTLPAPNLLIKIAQRIIEGRDRNAGQEQSGDADREDVYLSALWDVLAVAFGSKTPLGHLEEEALEKPLEALVEQFIESARNTQNM
jgi:hypothetical protein